MNIHSAHALLLAALLATAAVLAQGCSGLLTSEQAPRQYYLLTPVQGPAPPLAVPSIQLALQVSAIPGLDTDQVLALGADARLQQYGNARWPDHLPEVLTSTLQRSLEATGWFATVGAADRAADGGWLLRLEAREFFGIRNAAGDTSSVRTALAGSIDCGGRRHSLQLSDTQPITAQRLASVVAAHQSGLDAVTRQLFGQLLQSCLADGTQ
jgi:ABC-type uncharacterized transport system auxiliary subunit